MQQNNINLSNSCSFVAEILNTCRLGYSRTIRMFRRKKKQEEAVPKVSPSVEQLLYIIKEHPEGLKFEEIQGALSKKNMETYSFTLHEMLVKLERDKAVKSEDREKKQVGIGTGFSNLFLESGEIDA